MRKQYHFMPGETGFDAWDVDHLIARSAGLPVQDVPLDSIWEVDSVYWFNDGDEVPTVRSVIEHIRLVDAVDPTYPIILGADGRVMDGMHRVVRAILKGQRTIRAIRFENDPDPDYRNCRPRDLQYDE
jgi:hypothetical protein